MKRIKCPFCGGDLKWVIKKNIMPYDPISPKCSVGVRCYGKDCKQFCTYVLCWPENIDAAMRLIRREVSLLQEG